MADSVELAERLDAAELAERVRRALEPREVISALRELGITTEDFELVTGADQRTIRRWEEGTEPRSQASDAIDRLRVAALYLLQRNAMPPKNIGRWLRSRNLELDLDTHLGVRRPLDAIRQDQLPDVLAAVNAFLHPLDGAEDVAQQLRRTAVETAERETARAHAAAASRENAQAAAGKPQGRMNGRQQRQPTPAPESNTAEHCGDQRPVSAGSHG